MFCPCKTWKKSRRNNPRASQSYIFLSQTTELELLQQYQQVASPSTKHLFSTSSLHFYCPVFPMISLNMAPKSKSFYYSCVVFLTERLTVLSDILPYLEEPLQYLWVPPWVALGLSRCTTSQCAPLQCLYPHHCSKRNGSSPGKTSWKMCIEVPRGVSHHKQGNSVTKYSTQSWMHPGFALIHTIQ